VYLMDFNINDYVMVQLTERGKRLHRERHDDLFKHGCPYEYAPPKEDAMGWSRWQAWELMQAFGEHISMGSEPPFGTHIKFEMP
jgi:Mn-dependent DtxR family transcriptional regulator